MDPHDNAAQGSQNKPRKRERLSREAILHDIEGASRVATPTNRGTPIIIPGGTHFKSPLSRNMAPKNTYSRNQRHNEYAGRRRKKDNHISLRSPHNPFIPTPSASVVPGVLAARLSPRKSVPKRRQSEFLQQGNGSSMVSSDHASTQVEVVGTVSPSGKPLYPKPDRIRDAVRQQVARFEATSNSTTMPSSPEPLKRSLTKSRKRSACGGSGNVDDTSMVQGPPSPVRATPLTSSFFAEQPSPTPSAKPLLQSTHTNPAPWNGDSTAHNTDNLTTFSPQTPESSRRRPRAQKSAIFAPDSDSDSESTSVMHRIAQRIQSLASSREAIHQPAEGQTPKSTRIVDLLKKRQVTVPPTMAEPASQPSPTKASTPAATQEVLVSSTGHTSGPSSPAYPTSSPPSPAHSTPSKGQTLLAMPCPIEVFSVHIGTLDPLSTLHSPIKTNGSPWCLKMVKANRDHMAASSFVHSALMDAITICLECTSTVIPSVNIPANQLEAVKYYLEQRPYTAAFKTKKALSSKRYRSYYHPDDVDENKRWIVCFVDPADSDVLKDWLSRLSQLIGSGRFQSQSYKDWNHYVLRLTTAPSSSDPALAVSHNSEATAELPKEDQETVSPAEAEFQRLKTIIENGSDSDMGDELSLSAPSRRLSTHGHQSLLEDPKRLFIYPFSGVKSVTVTTHDLYRLNDGEYLNDSVIEFYLKYLQERLVATNPELAADVHIFNTFFYPQLVARSNRILATECYDRVKSWTSKVDIFKKRFIIIPIHDRAHWFLALIVNPGLMVSEAVDGESTPSASSSSPMPPTTADSTQESHEATATPLRRTRSHVQVSSTEVSPSRERIDVNLTNLTGMPTESPSLLPVPDFSVDASIGDSIKRRYEKKLRSELKRHSRSPRKLHNVFNSSGIFILDSLGLHHPMVFRILNSYLRLEAETKQKTVVVPKLQGAYAKVPLQTNHCDCGVFVLEYVETFLREPTFYLEVMMNRLGGRNAWFQASIIRQKRQTIHKTIVDLAKRYQQHQATTADS